MTHIYTYHKSRPGDIDIKFFQPTEQFDFSPPADYTGTDYFCFAVLLARFTKDIKVFFLKLDNPDFVRTNFEKVFKASKTLTYYVDLQKESSINNQKNMSSYWPLKPTFSNYQLETSLKLLLRTDLFFQTDYSEWPIKNVSGKFLRNPVDFCEKRLDTSTVFETGNSMQSYRLFPS